MSQAFTPVSAAVATAASADPGSPSAVADPKAVRPFRPIAGGGASDPPPPLVAGEPKVTFERDGDRITCIRIKCGCGHTIELACSY